METLHIKRLEARYHLSRANLSTRERLDRLLHEMLDSAIELALQRNGIPAYSELCIRKLYVPVRLRLGSTDLALVTQWSLSFADCIAEALKKNDGTSVVHYRSRLHGLMDFASAVANRHYLRAWAWSQLGFTQATNGVSDAQYLADLGHSLVDEPEYIVPLLKYLAQTGHLTKLAAHVDSTWWHGWAEAALAVADIDPGTLEDTSSSHTKSRNRIAPLVEASTLASFVLQTPSIFFTDDTAIRSLSALILLESEPGLSRVDRNEFKALIDAVQDYLSADTDEPMTARADDQTQDEGMLFTRKQQQTRTNNESTGDESGIPKHQPLDDQDNELQAFEQSAEDDVRHTRTVTQDDAVSLNTSAEERETTDEDEALPGVQVCAETAFGGLLFLLKIIEALEIPDEIVRHPRLKQRPIRWVLQQLALVLIDADEKEPAILAFCGLEPGTALPWERQPPVSELEHALLLHWRNAIVALLRSRLERDGVSDARLLYEICSRQARIVTDPGWFEIIFSLNDVSTEYRRVALDLDPGYLPWLGIVMKFTYE